MALLKCTSVPNVHAPR